MRTLLRTTSLQVRLSKQQQLRLERAVSLARSVVKTRIQKAMTRTGTKKPQVIVKLNLLRHAADPSYRQGHLALRGGVFLSRGSSSKNHVATDVQFLVAAQPFFAQSIFEDMPNPSTVPKKHTLASYLSA
jgi:hypothetical protein